MSSFLKKRAGLAALLTIAAEFIPVYLGMLVQLGLLSGCGAPLLPDRKCTGGRSCLAALPKRCAA